MICWSVPGSGFWVVLGMWLSGLHCECLADVISFLWGFFESFVLFEYSQDCSGMVCVWHFSYHNEPIFRAFSPVKLLHPFMGFPVPSFVMCERTLYFFFVRLVGVPGDLWALYFMTGHRFNCPRILFLKV